MKFLMFAASLRKDSVNKKLIRLAAKLLQDNGYHVDVADFADFDMPLYNGDIEATSGLPTGALKFKHRMESANAVIISSPEYNYSTPGTLKNLIDWLSRDKSAPLQRRNILLLSASPALVGGNRGLWHTRVPLECCGAFVYPDMFSLASAYSAFDEQGNLVDAKIQERLQSNLDNFAKVVQLMTASTK